jgi:protein-S-isoprenylcysteine O-methyltransferase Ste14
MPPPEPTPQRGSWLSVVLASMLLLVVCTLLFFLTLGGFGWVMVAGGCVFAFAAFHYLVWGWWLGRVIREDVEAEDRDAANKL